MAGVLSCLEDDLSDLIISWIRTGVAVVGGSVIAWLAVRGIKLDPASAAAVVLAVGGACVTLYQVAVSALQRRWPWVGLLLGSTKAPSYSSVRSTRERRPGGRTGWGV
ncbi:hypothetical protein SAMN05421505_1618 [Sinosporangium album]|uniref:Uncharacterized protein n=1 Tax=Sinosporangium album TaxID=504805 RepID=A0A1G8L498_9ACTN|nr:hypothetical protein SAMN05421505_1618 [Sinosporangium album]